MGKRKSKKRKNKLARPPKRSKQPVPQLPPLPYEEAEHDLGEDLSELDAPTTSLFTKRENRPFGAVHPSLYDSRRYQKFRDKVAAIRASLPDTVTDFATYDVPDLKDRQWLRIYALKKKAGELPEWQQLILEKAGFNWVHGRPPRPKREPKKRATPKHEVKWRENYNALAEACAKGTNPLLGLLCCDDALYQWLHRQINRAKAGKLSAERLGQLEALPIDLDLIRNDPGFGKWRTRLKAYATNEMAHPDRWSRSQARARAAGKMPQWRIDVLDALEFDWEAWAEPKSSPRERMEDRWRAKLDRYLAQQAASGRRGPLPASADKSLRPWISRMREYYKKGTLRPEIVEEFRARGFVFEHYRRHYEDWETNYKKLCAFKEEFGHVRLPSSYVDDPDLGQWLGHQRERMRKGKLTGEKLERLQKLGVSPRDRERGQPARRTHTSPWLKAFREIETILKEKHDGRLPRIGRFPEKNRSWLKRQQKKFKAGALEPWQVERLEAIGFDPEWIPRTYPRDYAPGSKRPPRGVPLRYEWSERMERLRRFVEEHGHAKVPRGHPDKKLRAFVESVRTYNRKGKLTESEIAELRELRFIFSPFDEVSPAWMRQYELLKAFAEKHGHGNVPRAYPENQSLAEFVAQERQRGRKGRLLAEHIRLLDALDFRWSGGRPVPKDAAKEAQ